MRKEKAEENFKGKTKKEDGKLTIQHLLPYIFLYEYSVRPLIPLYVRKYPYTLTECTDRVQAKCVGFGKMQ